MERIRVAATAVRTTPLAIAANLAVAKEVVAAARARGATLVCLPELVLTGYGCEDAFHAPFVVEHALEALEVLLPDTRGLVVSVGMPFVHRRSLFNVAALLVDGSLAGFAAKKNLAGDGLHYEARWFDAWPSGVVDHVDVLGCRVPLGDLLFDIGGVRIGFEICEDAWVAARPAIALGSAAVDVVLNPSASHFAFGKAAVRERLVIEGSRAIFAGYVYSNLLGNEAGRVIYDGDAIVAESGRLVARGPRLSFERFNVTDAVLDIARCRTEALRTPSYRVDPSVNPSVVRMDFTWPSCAVRPQAGVVESPHAKEDELALAVSNGLFDHLVKSRTQGFVVSLSGGVDSTSVVVLIRLAVRLAVRELGFDAVRTRLAHIRGISEIPDEAALMHRLLTTMYQATANSSEYTRDAARQTSSALGSRHLELDVDELVRGYVGLISNAIDRPLTWDEDDVALQNIQARVRAPSAWLVANVEGKLLLTTSNRSEAALGYATMDGDTAGGLAPIAGIDKAYLRKWLVIAETRGVAGTEPIRELAAVNQMPSTPELRPSSANQRSEDDLMPFELLDKIERAIVRDRRSPADTLRVVLEQDASLDPAFATSCVRRFCTLFAQNQWKRERYAPSFHLDDENLDPKTWFRFPILSGGFADALVELDDPGR